MLPLSRGLPGFSTVYRESIGDSATRRIAGDEVASFGVWPQAELNSQLTQTAFAFGAASFQNLGDFL